MKSPPWRPGSVSLPSSLRIGKIRPAEKFESLSARGQAVARAGIFTLLPLAFWTPFQDCFPLSKLLVLVLLAGTVSIPLFSRPNPPALAWAAAWTAWPVCLVFAKAVPPWRAVPETLVLGLPVLAAAASCGKRREAGRSAVLLVLTAVLMSAYGLLEAFGGDLGNWISPFGKGVASTVGNPDLFGGFLILPFALSLSMAAGRRSPWWAAAGLIGAAVVSAESRAAWLGAALAAAAVAALTRSRAVMGGLAAAAVFGGAWLAFNPSAAERVFSAGALTQRLWTWKQTCRAAVLSPLTGRGPASFRTAYLAQQTASRDEDGDFYHYTEYAHCEPLHFMLELGLIGTGLWSWCILCFLRMLWLSGSRVESPRLWAGTAAAWAGLAPVFLLSFPFHVPATLAPLLLMTALLAAGKGGSAKGVLAAALWVGVLAALAWMQRQAVVSAGLREGSIAAAAGLHAKAADLYGRLLGLTKGDVRLYWNLAAALRAEGRFEDAVSAARKASLLEPDFYEVRHETGMSLKALGRLAEAEAEYRRAIRINPGFAPSFNNLGNILGETGRLEEAEEVQRRAVELSPDFDQARRNLAITLLGLGKRAEARRILEGGRP